MDEMAELFACHPSCGGFEGIPTEAFSAFIEGKEYGPDEMPKTLGLYCGQYTVVFRPGESLCVVFVRTRSNANRGCVLIQGSITSIVRAGTNCCWLSTTRVRARCLWSVDNCARRLVGVSWSLGQSGPGTCGSPGRRGSCGQWLICLLQCCFGSRCGIN